MSRFVFWQTPSDVSAKAAPLYADLAAARMRLALVRLTQKYRADQPRVLAGNRDGGQWMDAGGGRVHVAANDHGQGRVATDADAHAEAMLPKKPKGVDIDSNILKAERMRAILAPPLNLLWFYEQVHLKGPWDYKNQYGRPYTDLGNFNFGATGAALGLSDDTLFRTAGWAQTRSGNSGEGNSPGLLSALAGIGGQSPFGDDPKDQDWIAHGIQYYRQKHGR